MKKILLLASFLLLPSFCFSTGFPVTDIPRVIMEFIVEKVLMEQDQKVQQAKLQELIRVLREVKQIRARHTELLGIEEDLEKELRMVREVRHLKLHDILRITEKVLAVSSKLYARDLPYLEEYALLQQALPGLESSGQLYEFMLGGTSVYADLQGQAPESYQEHAFLLQEQAIKRYAMEIDASQRSIHTALTYHQLADDLTEKARDLQEQVGKEGGWNLLGLGDIFSNPSPGVDWVADLISVDISGLADQVKDWARDIKDELNLNDTPLLGKNQEDHSGKIQEQAEAKLKGFDFEGLLASVLGGVSDLLPVPEYRVEIAKEGMGLRTGERIEVQGIALDNLDQALELNLEADQILLKATQPTDHQQQVDATYENALFRKSLTGYQLY